MRTYLPSQIAGRLHGPHSGRANSFSRFGFKCSAAEAAKDCPLRRRTYRYQPHRTPHSPDRKSGPTRTGPAHSRRIRIVCTTRCAAQFGPTRRRRNAVIASFQGRSTSIRHKCWRCSNRGHAQLFLTHLACRSVETRTRARRAHRAPSSPHHPPSLQCLSPAHCLLITAPAAFSSVPLRPALALSVLAPSPALIPLLRLQPRNWSSCSPIPPPCRQPLQSSLWLHRGSA